MSPPLARTALAALILTTGCDQLCTHGYDLGLCSAECESAGTLEGVWAAEPASDVLVRERAVVCNAATNDTGFGGSATVWFPGSVVEATNMALKAGEAAGFVRVQDSWSSATMPAEPNDPRSATLSNGAGHEVQLNVRSSPRFGSFISYEYAGLPDAPQLRGDVTLMMSDKGGWALHDGVLEPLFMVPRGELAPLDDGFYVRTRPVMPPDAPPSYVLTRELLRYGPGNEVTKVPAPPTESKVAILGHGPDGAPWVLGMPKDEQGTGQLGSWNGEAWSMVDIPPRSPALTWGLSLVHVADTKFLSSGQGVHAYREGAWSSVELPNRVDLDGLLAFEDKALALTDRGVLFAVSWGEEALTVEKLGRYPDGRLLAGRPGQAIIKTPRKVWLLKGDTKVELSAFRGKGRRIAAGPDGTMVVSKSENRVLDIRRPDGTMERYPAQGDEGAPIVNLAVDPQGRIWGSNALEVYMLEGTELSRFTWGFDDNGPQFAFMGRGASLVGAAPVSYLK